MPKRFPLVQQLYTRAPGTPLTQDSRLVNAYVEADPQTKEYWVYKRVGIAPKATYTAPLGVPGGTYYYPELNQTLVVAGGNLYVNNVQIFGALPAGLFGNSPVWFETVNSNPQTIVIMSPFHACYYT